MPGRGVPLTADTPEDQPTSNPPTTDPPTDTPPPATEVDMSMYQWMANWLQSMGLGDLFTVDQNGQPSGWLWDQLKNGNIDTDAELQIAVESTDSWKRRFDVIVQQRALAAQGQPVQVMTAAQVVEYEARATQLLRQAGLPSWFYDDPTDFTKLMVNGVSLDEVNQRVNESMTMVRNVDPAIRDMFSQMYGVGQSDAALTAFFLDPNKTMAKVDEAARAAYTASSLRKQGQSIDLYWAERAGQAALSRQEFQQRVEQAGSLSSLASETFGETSDLTGDTLVAASVVGDAKATNELSRRLSTRQAANREATGGSILTERGVTGAGVS